MDEMTLIDKIRKIIRMRHDDVVSANNMDLVILLQNNKKVKKTSIFSEEDLKYQEARRQRKVRKLTFEER